MMSVVEGESTGVLYFKKQVNFRCGLCGSSTGLV